MYGNNVGINSSLSPLIESYTQKGIRYV